MHIFSLFLFPTSYVIPFRLIALYYNFAFNSPPILGLIHNKELALKAAEESANSNGSSRFERKISMNQLSNIERYTVWKGRVVGWKRQVLSAKNNNTYVYCLSDWLTVLYCIVLTGEHLIPSLPFYSIPDWLLFLRIKCIFIYNTTHTHTHMHKAIFYLPFLCNWHKGDGDLHFKFFKLTHVMLFSSL